MTILHRVSSGIVVIATIAFASALHAQQAQDPNAAQPERPTIATHAGTVAPGWFEIETGIERDRVTAGITALSTPTLFKFGVAPRVQFDVSITTVQASANQSMGIGDGGVGVKWRLGEGLPILGNFAVQPSVKFPTGSVSQGTGTGTTISGPFAWAAELYGSPGFAYAPAVGFLTGPTWTLAKWFVADAGIIMNVAGPQPPAVYAGLTWNVGRIR